MSFTVLPDCIGYQDGLLTMDSVSIESLAENIATPFYCYAAEAILDNFHQYARCFGSDSVFYAVKANSNLSILKMLVDSGAGMDVVSEGELHRVLKVGANKIVFSGVGKGAEELLLAIESGIYQINVESISELLLLQNLARSTGKRVSIAVRINPEIDSGTNDEYITTGLRGDKFGILKEDLPDFFATLEEDYVDFVGLSVHVGSNMCDLSAIEKLCVYMKKLVLSLRSEGKAVKRIDMGGGVGIGYRGDEQLISIPCYASMLNDLADDLACELMVEPGRSVVGNSGLLVCRVIHVKHSGGTTFIIVDAGMNDLIRVALYRGAYHRAVPIKYSECVAKYTIVGPICESSDIFVRDAVMPKALKRGDLIALCSAGAYGFVNANNYNSRLMPAEILVNRGEYRVVRKRQSYEDLWRLEEAVY